ncbi:MAG: hypothetical protein ABSF98_29155 [Bryobacteraceae bacterium]
MLKQILEAARLDEDYCARLLGVPPSEFREWLDGKSPLPRFILSELSAILGHPTDKLVEPPRKGRLDDSALAPAVWYKLREPRLKPEDRAFVALVRKLGFYMDQLQTVRQNASRQFELLFATIRRSVDSSAPPTVQGRQAAAEFRKQTGLSKGQTGIGEDIRRSIRNLGFILIESPLPHSQLEGCCMRVGRDGRDVPCVFANTYGSTWFRRNVVIMHELGHAVFDLGSSPVTVDYLDGAGNDEFTEVRAQAFARDALVPASVLSHATNKWGIHWNSMTPVTIAQLMASTHVEQRTLLEAACEYGYFPQDKLEDHQKLNCSSELAALSDHALTTEAYLRRQPSIPLWIAQNRNTALGGRSLRLPAGYVEQVILAFNDGEISRGKAAEMLLMDRSTMEERFGGLLTMAE